MSQTFVNVVDDDEAARESLAFLLRSAGLPTRTFPSAQEFLAELAAVQGGCVITDLRMPEMNGLDLLREIKKRKGQMPVLVITGHGDIPLAVEAMRSGAIDFLEKPFDDQILLSVVRAALQDQSEQSRQMGKRSEIAARLDMLSARERQVLDGLIAGHPNKVIAYDLGISIRTIEIYRANVMTKMQAASLSDLIRMAVAVLPAPAPQSATG